MQPRLLRASKVVGPRILQAPSRQIHALSSLPSSSRCNPRTSSPLPSTRHLSLLSLFGRNSTTPQPIQATPYQQWLEALQSDPKRIYQSYHEMISSIPLQKGEKPLSPIDDELLSMLSKEAAKEEPNVDFVLKVLDDRKSLLKRGLSSRFDRIYVDSLIKIGREEDAFAWIRNNRPKVAESFMSQTVATALAANLANGKHDAIQASYETLRSLKLKPSLEAYRIILASNLKTSQGRIEPVLPLLVEIRGAGFGSDPSILATLLDSHADRDGPGNKTPYPELKEIAKAVKETLQNPATDLKKPQFHNLVNSYLRYTSHTHRTHHDALNEVKEFEKNGFVPSDATFLAIVDAGILVKSADELVEIGQTLGMEPPAEVWRIAIQSHCRLRKYEAAVQIYDEAIKYIQPTWQLVEPLFAARTLHIPGGKGLDEIYQDIQHGSGGVRAAEGQVPLKGYEDLLLSIGAIRNRLFVPKILSILLDMRNRDLKFDEETTTTVLQSLMVSAGSHNNAYNIFTNVRGLGTPFTRKAYLAAIDSLLNMPVTRAKARYPPPRLFFSILKDMLNDGHEVGLDPFRVLFLRLRRASIPVRYSQLEGKENPNADLLQDLREAHFLLRMSAAVTPDVYLLNVLMDGYARSGGFTDALRIWEDDLVLPRIFDSMSISIVLDTCSHFGAAHQAFAVWNFLLDWERQSRSNALPPKAWETWIEALCRLDLEDEVRRTLEQELGTEEIATLGRATSTSRLNADSRRQHNPSIPRWRVTATQKMWDIPKNFAWDTAPLAKRAVFVKLDPKIPPVSEIERIPSDKPRKSKSSDSLEVVVVRNIREFRG